MSIFNKVTKTFQWGQHTVKMETGEVARQAGGAVLLDMEGTVVLATVVGSKIAKAGQDLALRLAEKCPQCQQVNFVVKEKKPGLPCAMCSLPTHKVKLTLRICDGCGYSCAEPVAAIHADPMYCQFCNP